MKIVMRPETIARRANERTARNAERKAVRVARLTALVERDGADSVWAEMLAEVAN